MRESENFDSFGRLSKEQTQSESDLLSDLMDENEIKGLLDFEGSLAGQRTELLFKLTTKIEDTRTALKQAEGLVNRLKKYLNQLQSLYQALSK